MRISTGALLSASAIAASALVVAQVPMAQAPSPCERRTHQYVVEVTSLDGNPVSFKGAVGANQRLQIVETVTPYTYEFAGNRAVAMFAATVPERWVKAALFVRRGSEMIPVGHAANPAPAIYESVSCNEPLIRAFGTF